jgi:translation initiation factor 5B
MTEKHLRSPICAVLGHVDHGKSSVLDYIRHTNIVASEAGAITQAIGASIIPIEVIKKKCGNLLNSLNMSFTIPGLLFIDTPGHAAFTSLRKRGGNIADIAIVVVDINEGFKPQTIESIEILKQFKTPFVIALNKLDLIPGFRVSDKQVLGIIAEQTQDVQTIIEKKLYEIVGQVHENFELVSERFDRISDFTKEIALIPCSAKTGMGVPEILMVLSALAQKFLENNLNLEESGPAKGTVLEVKEEKGIGMSMDVILYSGTLKTNDVIVIGGIDKPIITKVRGLFEPAPLAEMRDAKSKFKGVKQVVAATGVKISAPDIKNVVAGMPIVSSTKEEAEKVGVKLQEEVEDVMIETENRGIIIKADTIGSLEAVSRLLQEKDIPIRKATIGNISKKDLMDAESNIEEEPLAAVILGFNIKVNPDAEEALKKSPVTVINEKIIYALIDNYIEFKEKKRKELEAKELEGVTRPCKIKLLPGYIFRQSSPAVVGAEVYNGTLKTGMLLMKEGKVITSVKSLQKEKESISVAEKGLQIAVSMDGVTVDRQIKEGDDLYSGINELEFRKLKKLKRYLTPDEVECIKEIAVIMRTNNPLWGL